VDQKASLVTFEMWKVAYWMIGTLGVAGTIALFAFAPAVATGALNAVVRFFGLVLSYRIGCAVVAAALSWFIADYVRHSIEDDKHAAANAAFEAAQVARDERIKIETRELVWKEIADATAENAVTDKEVKEFTDALPKPPETGNVFRVGADSCRLRKLAGQADCGSDGAQGVPKADTKPASLKDRIRKRLPGSDGGSVGRSE
jgi:hypothetical protein